MTTGRLPVPKATGPVAGTPGHFKHHDWLEGAVQALDERLLKEVSAVTVTTNLVPNTYTPIKYDSTLYDTGLDIAIDPAGGVVFGPGAPEGYYRLDIANSIPKGSTAGGGDRRQRLMLNGVEQGAWYISTPGSTNSATSIVCNGIIYLPALAVIAVTVWHNMAVAAPTGTGSQCHLVFEYLGPGPAAADGGTQSPESDDAAAEARPANN